MRNDDATRPATIPDAGLQDSSRRLSYDLLRLICILGVVAIHTFGPVAANPDVRGSTAWLPSAMLSSGFVWVVPVFVMLSGALTLTPRAHRDGPAKFLRRRAVRILPALVFWTLFYLIVMQVLVFGERYSLGALATVIADGYAYPHLYFLYLIAGLSFVAPALAAFLHGGNVTRAQIVGVTATVFTVIVFAVPGVLALGGVDRDIPLGMLTFWLPYVGYFILGYALSISKIPTGVVAASGTVGLACWCLVLYQAFAAGTTPVLDAWLRPDYLGAGVAVLSTAVFIVAVRALDRIRVGAHAMKLIRTLSDAAFGVYLIHLVVLLLPYFLMPGFQDRSSLGESVLAYVLIVAISFPAVVLGRRIPIIRSVL